jgi:eukaryotic-like serine/threonine-protein kinase
MALTVLWKLRQTGAGVQGIGPGTVLGSRYALRRRLSHGPDLERWFALDVTLQRDVALTVVGSSHPNRAGVLDAARRAAGVEDARLVRILDVGAEADSSFIVEETMSGSESLATLLLQGPLPAEEARRVAGETAKGLETAGQRGLHHLQLTPHHVLIAPDGAIRVSGVAVTAAISGPDDKEPEAGTALRRDALCLVAMVYAALTSRWPLDEKVSGVEPAPRMSLGAVSPSELVAGVPDDLDALCRSTLNEANGPLTPGEFADRIAPWPRERVNRAGIDPTLVLRLPGPEGASDSAPVAIPVVLPAPFPAAADGPAPALAGATRERPSLASASGPAGPGQTPHLVPGPDGAGQSAAPAVNNHAAPTGGGPATVLGTARAGTGAVAGVPGGSRSSLAEAAGALTESHRADQPKGLPVGLSPKDEIGPPLPMLPASTAMPPSRGQSKIVMLVMVAFVGAALYVGYHGLLGPGGDTGPAKPAPRPPVTASAPETTPASPAPQAAATAGGPIAILSAAGFDPQGDHGESNSQAPHVYDNDPATTWTTELYTTPQFGNLKKGVGLIIDLGQPTSVHQVTIDLANGPVDLTAYAATSPNLAGATEIGRAAGASGRVQLKASTNMPESQFVIVWFSSLAPVKGQFGASISEIALN